MIFSTSGPPQYVVVWLVFCEVKDIIGYLNINKFGCFRFFQEKVHVRFLIRVLSIVPQKIKRRLSFIDPNYKMSISWIIQAG